MARDNDFCYAIDNYGKPHVWNYVWEGRPDSTTRMTCSHCTRCGAPKLGKFDGTYDALTCWLDFGIKSS